MVYFIPRIRVGKGCETRLIKSPFEFCHSADCFIKIVFYTPVYIVGNAQWVVFSFAALNKDEPEIDNRPSSELARGLIFDFHSIYKNLGLSGRPASICFKFI